MGPSPAFRESLGVSGRALAVPLGGALLGAGLMAWMHGATGGMPWILVSSGLWVLGGPVALLAVGFCLWKRGPAHEDLRALVVGAVAFLLLLLPAHFAGGWFRDRKMEAWRAEGIVLAGRIQDYRKSEGAYPDSLDGFPGIADLEWRSLLTYRKYGKEDTFILTMRNPESFLGWDGWDWNPSTRTWDYAAD